ncbi:MAG: 4-hydroxy-3-methylbut-2-enyl diphosphate reductase [Gammaproteobacteria bacterium]|nr:4-hydroxy-3-methylbut-2-enyl diphosphate reductase [Gammaproteobacteria bacterium]
MQVLLAKPRGFCAGVDRAIEIVERALDKLGTPIFVRHEVVHNHHVVETLRARGAVFVEELHEVPDGATVIFSAHGVSRAVEKEAAARHLNVFDATCPLVTKVHMEVLRYSREGRDVVLIGHAGHPEVEGTMGRFDLGCGGRVHLVENVGDVAALQVRDPEKIAFVSQTTLSVDDTRQIIDALAAKFTAIKAPQREDICYATQNRQNAVKKLAGQVELLLVVGSANSSNSNRLREIAEQRGVAAYLINGALDVRKKWLQGVQRVGVTAGASAPETLVQELIGHLRRLGAEDVQELQGLSENVSFNLPQALREA